jgi:hypothetical protein
MKETKVKEEEEWFREQAIKKWEEKLRVQEKQSEKRKSRRVTSFHCTL